MTLTGRARQRVTEARHMDGLPAVVWHEGLCRRRNGWLAADLRAEALWPPGQEATMTGYTPRSRESHAQPVRRTTGHRQARPGPAENESEVHGRPGCPAGPGVDDSTLGRADRHRRRLPLGPHGRGR